MSFLKKNITIFIMNEGIIFEGIIFSQVLPWVWLGIVILCLVIEGFTMGLTTIWFSISAVVVLFLSFTPLSLFLQLLIFLVLGLVLLFSTRPIALKKLHLWKEKTNIDEIVGTECIVTKKITPLESGEIKERGRFWTARCEGGFTLPEGSTCVIKRISGVTAYVEPALKKEVQEPDRESPEKLENIGQ